MSKLMRYSIATLLILLGIIGSLLPVLQGWIFFLLALAVIFPDHPKVAHLMEKGETKLPRVVHFLRKLGIGTNTEEHTAPPPDHQAVPATSRIDDAERDRP